MDVIELIEEGEVFYENISIEEGAVVEAQIGKRKSKN